MKNALLNAIGHNGKAQQGPVIGKLLAEMPHLKTKVKEITPFIAEIVKEVNSLSAEIQQKIVSENWPKAIVVEKVKKEKRLPQLPNADKYRTIVTRFSPNPDAPIHLGSARAIILCHEYARKYYGKFLVRFEDTDPKTKKPQLQFYKLIKEDLNWLNCEPEEYFIQSDRLPIYYEYAEQLLQKGHAYVCTCKAEDFRKLVSANEPCPCRNLSPKDQMKRWRKMLDGSFCEGDAVVRVKTDLQHANPAIRDWPALRIIDTDKYPHPRSGNKYRVWPLYNLACGVDDHLLGITHIIRGKEHLTNQTRQEFMYRYFGWKYPEAIHYGRLKITGASLSKSRIMQGMNEGIYKSWDDPRLATFAALRRRGIQAEAIRQLIIEVGPKSQDITLSWENLYAYNRRVIENQANRYFFVNDPIEVVINDVPRRFQAKIPLHPDFVERGFRHFTIKPRNGIAKVWITKRDVERIKDSQVVRLMELFNIKMESLEEKAITAIYHSQKYEKAKRIKAPLIHWIPEDTAIRCQVILPDSSVSEGLAEKACEQLKVNTIVQFERFGFARIDSVTKNLIIAFYCHH